MLRFTDEHIPWSRPLLIFHPFQLQQHFSLFVFLSQEPRMEHSQAQ